MYGLACSGQYARQSPGSLSCVSLAISFEVMAIDTTRVGHFSKGEFKSKLRSIVVESELP
jgi:hypothetical protein